MSKQKPVISALSCLQPNRIVNINTGEIITWEIFLARSLTPLIDWVITETQRLYDANPESIRMIARDLRGNAESYGRSRGIKSDWSTLPRDVKAKSRVARLAVFKLMTETASYERNPNPRKQEHSFSRSLNLGAVDSQLAKLEREDSALILTWKCWEDEYELSFTIPPYAAHRNITKWSLPTVSERGFVYSMQETPLPNTGTNTAGIDLGRVQPFTLAILNDRGCQVAEYRARPQVQALNRKRERILEEVKHTRAKAIAYASLDLDDTILRENTRLLRNKASRLVTPLRNQIAADIITKTTRHNVSLLHLENLTWATGKKYGSKWAHGEISNKIEHTAARHGVRSKRVNPRGTSQSCHSCGTKLVHNTAHRTVRCITCQSTLDRDMNAALNIAKNKSYPVTGHRHNRDVPSSNEHHVITISNSLNTQHTLQTLET